VKLLWAVGTLPNSEGSWVKATKIGTASVTIPNFEACLKSFSLKSANEVGYLANFFIHNFGKFL